MKKMWIMLAAAMAFTACSKEDAPSAGDERLLAIAPTIANPSITPQMTSTRVTDTDFELNDAVGLTVTMTADQSKYAENRKLTYNGTEFAAAGFKWYEDVMLTSNLFAYYPYREGASTPTEFSVQEDQGGDGYAASDLIVAVKSGVKPTLSATAMTFRHKTTRVIIDVTNESGSAVTAITIKNAVCTGTIDTQTGEFVAKADAEAPEAGVTAYTATADKLYYALLVPQNGVQLKVSATTADGKTRTYTLGTTDLKSGENRRMEMNVQPADLMVTFGGPIAGWEDGDALLPDGEGEIDIPTVEWGGVKYPIVTLKDGRTWMAANLRYIPQGMTVSSDPTDGNGVWYPCDLDKAAAPELVEKNGLLYGYPVLLGMTGGYTSENYDKFEGVQGICPPGWHIPTKAEWLKLAGTGSGNLSDPTSPYYEATQGGAPIPALNADGFALAGCGYINAATAVAKPAYMANKSAADATAYGMGYYAGSTAYQITYNTAGDAASGIKNVQFYAGMVTYNANNHRLTVAYQGGYCATPVRCIKDLE